ncbi:hypothetical protein Pmani_009183 [Petrolisthes manimaculis]|uniref:Nuclear pore complex protein Nup153 n=1 Tax=Petrolisthes manimaculis TaxID=1843537 RepID=A0AAE1UDV0_9EUCA|nr:hypothetical protein Pmani_009183 [Petrolisthes manimaculis]
MLRSKKDVDRHVRDLLSKVKSEEERKVRGYNISRLYFNIKEYESARRYLSEFLSVRPKAVDAHRLLGQIYEGLGNKEKAIQSFKNAYELGDGQKDLVLKICELYTEVQADSRVLQFWAEEGDRVHPHHESVVKLREVIFSSLGSHTRQELEKLYIDEIKANPTVVRLQIKLLQLYKDWATEDKAKINEAYKYGCQVEARKAFSDSLEWYQTLVEVIETYQSTADTKSDEEFYINYLSALERQVYLTLSACSSTALLSQCALTDATALLHKFDQSLNGSTVVLGADTQFSQLMIGQLYFLMAIFLMHSAKKDGLTHSSTSAGALLFHACRFKTKESGRQPRSWTTRDQLWHKLGCHRLSQAAHILHHLAKTETEKAQFLNKVIQQCSNKEAQLSIYQTLYGASLANKKEKSFFLNHEAFISATLSYPEGDLIKEWDNVVGTMYCGSLGDMVWLCLQQVSNSIREPQPYYIFTLFEGLQFSSTTINSGAPETLCHLDLLAFLAATVYCHVAAAKDLHGPSPASLPIVLASSLTTTELADWWNAAYTLFTNRAHHKLSKLRRVLQHGLEVIRAHGNHGIGLSLMAHLAQCFTKWAAEAEEDGSTGSEVEALRERAEHYWQCVLTLIQRATRNVSTITPRNLLFPVHNSISMTGEERDKMEEEGKFFLATRLVQAGRQQEAIQALAELKRPEASFQRAMLYKEQAQAVLSDSSGDGSRSQQITLLTQARDTLYLTLDRLRMPGVDRFHPLNTKLSQQLEDVERRLSNLTLDHGITQREEDTASISDASQSPNVDVTNGEMGVIPHALHMFSTPHRENSATRITRQEARPSPERLDAQLRALSEVQENTLRNMEEQNAALREQIGALRVQNETLRNFCTTMAEDVKENSSLYRSMLEQNKKLSQEAHASLLGEIKLVHCANKDLQTQIQMMAADIADLKIKAADVAELKVLTRTMTTDLAEMKAMKSTETLPEVTEVKTSEEQVPVDLQGTAVVTPGLYGSYMGYYGQQPVPSPLMPTPGLFGNPPFFPPSTLPDQSFSMASSVSQVGAVSSMSQVSSTLMTPSSRMTVKEPSGSPIVSASQGGDGSQGGGLNMNWSVAVAPGTPATPKSQAGEICDQPPHAFQITMPPTSATLTPPPRSGSAFPGAFKSPSVQGTQNELKVSPVKSTAGEEENESYLEEEHDPCPDFKPIIPLPEKVEVRTGEEDEEVLFEERAKLFRFVDREWKERGTGIMKVLHNPAQSVARVLMRREQTHKICANHHIAANIELQPMMNNDKVWLWAAQDFADEELRMEKFCCRFKTVEIASSFKDGFMKAKAIAKEKEEKDAAASFAPAAEKSNRNATPGARTSLADMFRPPTGSWSCDVCLVSNKSESTKCVACDSPNPNASTPQHQTSEPQSQTPFAFFKFSPSSGSSTAPGTSAGFKFINSSSVTVTPINPPTTTTSGFSFKFGLGGQAETSVGSPTSTVQAPAASPNPDVLKDTGKFSLSGFTFTTTPTLKQDKTEEPPPPKPQEDKKKESIFAGFSFGSSTTNSQTSGFSFGTPTLGTKAGDTPGTCSGSIIGSKDGTTTLSFSSLATNSSPSSVFTMKNTKAFEPKTVFKGPGSPIKSPSKDDGDDKVEEYEPQVDFQPVVPMPDLVEVKTGEEEEEVLFCERSKLFRYDKDCREWKDRGVGDIKILKNKATGKIRILMRREQVLKVCANHFLTPAIKITPMPSSDKAWVWAAQDYADEEMREEQFAARFKSQELALSFKTAFEKAQQLLENAAKIETSIKPKTSTPKPKAASVTTSLAAMFKPAVGSWECSTCLVRSASHITTCPACSTNKPKSEASPKPTTSTPEAKGTSSKPTSLAAMFKPATGSWECDSCLVRNSADANTCAACQTNKPGYEPPKGSVSSDNKLSVSFGIKQNEAITLPNTTTSGSGFKFGTVENKVPFTFGIQKNTQPSSVSSTQPPFSFGQSGTLSCSIQEGATASDSTPAFSFGTSTQQSNKPFKFIWQPVSTAAGSDAEATLQSTTLTSTTPVPIPAASPGTTTPVKDDKAEFMFGSPGKYEFSFAGVKAKSPRSRDISLCESEDGLVEEDDGDHLYFEPVVPLPDKVEVVTGEENEEILYSHRAKLFRLVDGEWKERGLGDIKLLSHKEMGKVRILMRREQVHKICLNHYLKPDMEFRKKDEKTFYWVALDYAEGTPQNETLAVRFKTQEIALDFFKAANEAKITMGGAPMKLDLASTPKQDNTQTTTTATPAAAMPSPVVVSPSASPSGILSPSSFKICTPTSFSVASTTPSIFSGAMEKSIFGGPPSLGTSTPSLFGGNTTGSVFGGTPKSPASVFGGNAGATPSIFSPGKSICGTTTTTSSSVFGTTPTTPSLKFGATTTTSSIFGSSTNMSSSIFGTTTTTPSLIFGGTTSSSIFGGSLATTKPGSDGSASLAFVFGGSTTTSAVPRSTFSFGDKLSSEPETPSKPFAITSVPESSDGVEMIYEKKATPEQIERARKLYLPDNFYLYEDAPDCSGCIGCEDNAKKQLVKEQKQCVTTSTTDSPLSIASNTSSSVLIDGDFASKVSSNTNSSTLTFGYLASQAKEGAFSKGTATTSIFAAKSPGVVPVFRTTPKKTSEGGPGDEEPDPYDPHYEPIVPLPELVEVKTGEEDMEVIFSQRSKLYRYDGPTKQWKERGIGDFKILYDKEKNKYRLIQRREMVHKLCCNHYLTPQLELKPLQTSETAWCWYAIDYSDNLQGTSEQLALKFKTVEVARDFKTKFEGCQMLLRNLQASNSTSTDTSAVVVIPQAYPGQGDKYQDVDDDDEDEDDDDDDDDDTDDDTDDEDDATVIFSERCALLKKEGDKWLKLGQGELGIRYDGDVFGARVSMTADDGSTLAEHLIAIQTTMYHEDSSATWSVFNLKPEPAAHTTFKAEFSTPESLENFSIAFAEGKQYAEKSDLFEDPSVGTGEMDPRELYYGQGVDQHDG